MTLQQGLLLPRARPLTSSVSGTGCRQRAGVRPAGRPRLLVRASSSSGAATLEAPAQSSASLSAQYSAEMARMMEWGDRPFEYDAARGLYFHPITPDMLVGSQPQRAADIDILANEIGVSTILNLQEDKDMKYWGVSIDELSDRAAQLDVKLVRTPARDFDPHSLRAMLPAAVAALEHAKQSGGKVYVHCTAGLGRSPAVAIASLYWFGGMQLDEAYTFLTSIRPCGPKRDAIRAATYDMLRGPNHDWHRFDRLPSHAYAFLNDDDRAHIQRRVMEFAPRQQQQQQ